jgi:hypothetical protein
MVQMKITLLRVETGVKARGYEYMASKELVGGIFTAERDNYRYKEMAKM